MAFVKATVKLILRERRRYEYQSPVLCLGVPEIYATFPELHEWCTTLGGQPCAVSRDDVVLTDHPTGRKLGWVNAATFFKALTLDPVVTVDIPGAEHGPSIVHDLNEPFPESMRGKFKLVLDPGTTEHVFDVKTCLTNIVRVLAVGGVVVHQVPVYSYNGKTRVYAYDEDVLGARHALADRDQVRFTPMLLTFARKIEEHDAIRVPLQYEGLYHTRGAEHRERAWTRRARQLAQAVDDTHWHSVRAARMRLGRLVRMIRIRRRSFWV